MHAPAGASAEAAVAAAAHGILAHYLPAQAPGIIDPAYTASLATIPPGQAKIDGIATGQKVAAKLIAKRADDGFRAPVTYTPPNVRIPACGSRRLPRRRSAPTSGSCGHSASRPQTSSGRAGLLVLGSKRWARDYNEVKEIGSLTSTTRTAEQTLAAKFWAEPPVQQAHGSFRKFVLDHGLDLVDASRFMAMISVTYADALIACFDAKYHYAFWRPITTDPGGEHGREPPHGGRPGLDPAATGDAEPS